MAEQVYGAMQAGQGQAQTIQGAPRLDTIHSVGDEFNGIIGRLGKLAEVLRMMGDRITGVRPESIGKDQVDTPPSSMILDLRRKHSAMSELLAKCEQEAQRLASAIGGM